MKKFLKLALTVILLLSLAFVILIAFAKITDYTPPETELIAEYSNPTIISDSTSLNFVIWNIGYASLDKSMDFFYSGGKMTRPDSVAQVDKNLSAMMCYLYDLDKRNPLDIVMLQEVDQNSKRSYNVNQETKLSKLFPKFTADFATNYKVPFVPMPLNNPMGKVNSGILNLSKYVPIKTIRHSYKGNFVFPKSLFMLDRCFMSVHYRVSNNKELVVINTHNSAYDDGSLREQQMYQLKKFIINEYKKGNFVIVGGDWNQCPPNIIQKLKGPFDSWKFDSEKFIKVSSDFVPKDWKWVYKNDIPTNRRINEVYNQKTTLTTIIDYYLVSPNVIINSVETINLNFKNSDHNPVKAVFKLKK